MVAMCVAFSSLFFFKDLTSPNTSPGKKKKTLPNCFVEWLHNFAFPLGTYGGVKFFSIHTICIWG